MEQLTKDENKILKEKITEVFSEFSKENKTDKELLKGVLLWIFQILNLKTNYQEY